MDRGSVVWGWHGDPYHLHEQRWVSGDGTLTMLVKDDGRESYDPPPDPDPVPDPGSAPA